MGPLLPSFLCYDIVSLFFVIVMYYRLSGVVESYADNLIYKFGHRVCCDEVFPDMLALQKYEAFLCIYIK